MICKTKLNKRYVVNKDISYALSDLNILLHAAQNKSSVSDCSDPLSPDNTKNL